MKRIIEASLLQWKDKETRKPLLLQGARQVGKTYVLQDFAKKQFRKSHYFDLEELKAELSSGKTIPELAEEIGIDLEQLAVDKATEKLQQAVENGRLTQEEADQRLAELQERIENGELPIGPGGPGGHDKQDGPGGPGGQGGPDGSQGAPDGNGAVL